MEMSDLLLTDAVEERKGIRFEMIGRSFDEKFLFNNCLKNATPFSYIEIRSIIKNILFLIMLNIYKTIYCVSTKG